MDTFKLKFISKVRSIVLFVSVVSMFLLAACSDNRNITGGFEDKEEFQPIICEYVENEILYQWSHARTDKRFEPSCAYSVLGSDDRYIYIVFAGDDFILLEGSGVASANACVIPARLEYQFDSNELKITAHELPGDGAGYADGMKRLFPQDAMDKLDELRISGNNVKLAELAYKRACEKLDYDYVEGACIEYNFETQTK